MGGGWGGGGGFLWDGGRRRGARLPQSEKQGAAASSLCVTSFSSLREKREGSLIEETEAGGGSLLPICRHAIPVGRKLCYLYEGQPNNWRKLNPKGLGGEKTPVEKRVGIAVHLAESGASSAACRWAKYPTEPDRWGVLNYLRRLKRGFGKSGRYNPKTTEGWFDSAKMFTRNCYLLT